MSRSGSSIAMSRVIDSVRKETFCHCCLVYLHGHCSYSGCCCAIKECEESRKKTKLCKGLNFFSSPKGETQNAPSK